MTSQIRQFDIPALTSLRFFAAMLVVLYHNSYLGWNLHDGPLWIQNIVTSGYVGVDFFFVLSGFILASAYQHHDTLSYKTTFWIKRIARIYPVYLLAFLIDAPRVIAHFSENAPGVFGALKSAVAGLLSLLLIQSWFPPVAYTWNSPAWSLSVESFFFLIFPFVMWRLRHLSAKGIHRGLVLLFAALMAIYLMFDFFNPPLGTYMATFARTFPLFYLPEFVFGILVAKITPFYRASWVSSWGFICAGLVIFLVLALKPLSSDLLLPRLLVPFYGWLLLSVANNGLGTRFLTASPLVFWGNASYAIYLLHQCLKDILLPWLNPYPSPVVFLIYICVLLTVAGVVYCWFEKPLRSLLVKKYASSVSSTSFSN